MKINWLLIYLFHNVFATDPPDPKSRVSQTVAVNRDTEKKQMLDEMGQNVEVLKKMQGLQEYGIQHLKHKEDERKGAISASVATCRIRRDAMAYLENATLDGLDDMRHTVRNIRATDDCAGGSTFDPNADPFLSTSDCDGFFAGTDKFPMPDTSSGESIFYGASGLVKLCQNFKNNPSVSYYANVYSTNMRIPIYGAIKIRRNPSPPAVTGSGLPAYPDHFDSVNRPLCRPASEEANIANRPPFKGDIGAIQSSDGKRCQNFQAIKDHYKGTKNKLFGTHGGTHLWGKGHLISSSFLAQVASTPGGKVAAAPGGKEKKYTKAMESAFILSNVAPQDQHHNLNEWGRLEETVMFYMEQVIPDQDAFIIVGTGGYEGRNALIIPPPELAATAAPATGTGAAAATGTGAAPATGTGSAAATVPVTAAKEVGPSDKAYKTGVRIPSHFWMAFCLPSPTGPPPPPDPAAPVDPAAPADPVPTAPLGALAWVYYTENKRVKNPTGLYGEFMTVATFQTKHLGKGPSPFGDRAECNTAGMGTHWTRLKQAVATVPAAVPKVDQDFWKDFCDETKEVEAAFKPAGAALTPPESLANC